jgi:hypothetical protein
MRSLSDTLILNILAELNMAKDKRSALVRSDLATDRIDSRIEYLERKLEEIEKEQHVNRNCDKIKQ